MSAIQARIRAFESLGHDTRPEARKQPIKLFETDEDAEERTTDPSAVPSTSEVGPSRQDRELDEDAHSLAVGSVTSDFVKVSPPRSRPPPLPPRKGSDNNSASNPSTPSVDGSSTSSFSSQSSTVPKGPPTPRPIPPKSRAHGSVGLNNTSSSSLGVTKVSRGHNHAASSSSLHSVSLSDHDHSIDKEEGLGGSYEAVSPHASSVFSLIDKSQSMVSSPATSAISLGPPALPPRPGGTSPGASAAGGTSGSDTYQQPTHVPYAIRKHPPPPPPSYQAPPLNEVPSRSSARSSLASITSTTPSGSSLFSSNKRSSRASVSTINSNWTTQARMKKLPPPPPATRARYEALFDGNIKAQRDWEGGNSKRESARVNRRAVGWRGTSVDLTTTGGIEANEGLELDTLGEEEARLSGKVVKAIWSCSKLPTSTLRMIWEECDSSRRGSLDKQSFVNGMWRIDNELLSVASSTRTSIGSTSRTGSHSYIRIIGIPLQYADNTKHAYARDDDIQICLRAKQLGMPSKVADLPVDILLAFTRFLEAEDCLRLIQTSKVLHDLSTLKSFWVRMAIHLHCQRPVHHRPFDELSIPDLRHAILRSLRMASKWSGKPGTDSSPVRWIELDTADDELMDGERRAVSWVWFLEDGEHIICVIEDAMVQVWNLASRQLVTSFNAGGTLQRALNIERPSIVLHCFTPLDMFDPDRREGLRSNFFRMVRTPEHIHLHFGDTLDFLLYTYSLGTISTLLARQTQPHDHNNPRILLPPTFKTTFHLSKEQSQGLPNASWTSLGDSCLWDGGRVGFLSGAYQTVGTDRQHILTLSALSIGEGDLPRVRDVVATTSRVEPYSRPLVYIRPNEYDAGHTPDGYWLMSQPNWAKSAIWALAPSGDRRQIKYLVVGQFPDVSSEDIIEESAAMSEGEERRASSSSSGSIGGSAPVRSRGHTVEIDVSPWIEAGQRVYDLDLDDCHGRVGLGLANGKALILEFV
ncbi:hypothetical protein FRC17_001687 [Serendipita sp. 399]|nr:hypothetical protein FRC17_001687 [Serendipita sp. 399]